MDKQSLQDYLLVQYMEEFKVFEFERCQTWNTDTEDKIVYLGLGKNSHIWLSENLEMLKILSKRDNRTFRPTNFLILNPIPCLESEIKNLEYLDVSCHVDYLEQLCSTLIPYMMTLQRGTIDLIVVVTKYHLQVIKEFCKHIDYASKKLTFYSVQNKQQRDYLSLMSSFNLR